MLTCDTLDYGGGSTLHHIKLVPRSGQHKSDQSLADAFTHNTCRDCIMYLCNDLLEYIAVYYGPKYLTISLT